MDGFRFGGNYLPVWCREVRLVKALLIPMQKRHIQSKHIIKTSPLPLTYVPIVSRIKLVCHVNIVRPMIGESFAIVDVNSAAHARDPVNKCIPRSPEQNTVIGGRIATCHINSP